MNQSIMIEVDKTTENILNMIEERISTGSIDAMEQVKDDIIQELDSNSKRIRMSLDDSTKKVLTASDEAQEQASNQGQQLNQVLINFQVDFIDKLGKVETTLQEQSKRGEKQLATLVGSVETCVQQSVTTVKQFVEQEVKDSFKQNKQEQEELQSLLMTTIKHLHEDTSKAFSKVEQELREKNTQTEQLIAKVNELTDKLERVEEEAAWANQPFYKKWFSKGRE